MFTQIMRVGIAKFNTETMTFKGLCRMTPVQALFYLTMTMLTHQLAHCQQCSISVGCDYAYNDITQIYNIESPSQCCSSCFSYNLYSFYVLLNCNVRVACWDLLSKDCSRKSTR